MSPGNGATSVHPERSPEVSLVVYMDGPKAGSVRVLRLPDESQFKTFMPIVQRPMTVAQAKAAAPLTSSHEVVTMYRVAMITIDRKPDFGRLIPAAKVIFMAQRAHEMTASLGKPPGHYLALNMTLPLLTHDQDLPYALSHAFQLISNGFGQMGAYSWGSAVLAAAGLRELEQGLDGPLLKALIDSIDQFIESHPPPEEDEE